MTEQFNLKRRPINLRDILPPDFPEIVVLCGSTRFKKEFISENFRLTMEGKIVLSVGFFSHADAAIYTPTEEEKKAVDQLHFRKIDLADRAHILNVGGYVGSSTQNEIAYALSQGKKITYLEDH